MSEITEKELEEIRQLSVAADAAHWPDSLPWESRVMFEIPKLLDEIWRLRKEVDSLKNSPFNELVRRFGNRKHNRVDIVLGPGYCCGDVARVEIKALGEDEQTRRKHFEVYVDDSFPYAVDPEAEEATLDEVIIEAMRLWDESAKSENKETT